MPVLWYNDFMIRVDGKLIKTYISDIDGYKYSIGNGYRYFNELEDAINYANDVYVKTKIMLGIRDVTRDK